MILAKEFNRSFIARDSGKTLYDLAVVSRSLREGDHG